MSRFLSKRFDGLEEYVPGEQPRDMKYVKLNTNESPYPPSPLVLKRVNSDEVKKLNLYPDPDCKSLRDKLAEFYGVLPENVFISNGSDEILSFSFMAFCDGEKKIAFPDISYGFYKVYGDLYGLDCTVIPLKDDFSIDVDEYCGINKNVVIANPNAPTGMSVSLDDVEKILRSNPDNIVIIDEAYVDFGGTSCIPLIKKYDNLLVVRTYSKSRSMAGARLGFSIASKEITADLNKIKYSTNPYNINRLTLIAGEAALDENHYYEDAANKIIKTRTRLSNALINAGFTVLPSDANFIFVRCPDMDGETLYLELKKRGVLVRHFKTERIKDYLRISIGTDEQIDILLEKIFEITGRKA
ncbi:MAG: histidinol-phosphate transaminase [Clostridiales bacterium]|nr:histidinol-phosphate transaminase [Clostridiales bacterium]